ncbi:PTS lactose/cellobiose transporter subunit IIA [Acetonema longum]|uniref:Putative cellobiose-specific phosphotransferasesystem, enzyme IIA n=1 Tax=Acetonema longum DSM 6540 TaxID=1009370 RepID=F7NFX7_9FIRM|nr:PTS lactose/cellobiose transporter subunit IIA [Acetonema longum]EGO65040.1 putative cellobiose-specific phosphotransferasesystem, enzyme IIA [Acetonema longum DSM 6540]
MEIMEVVMKLIVDGGNARSRAMEAIELAKTGEFALAQAKLDEAGEHISKAHGAQTGLLTKEASGDCQQVTLLMVHAQDHLMNAITVRDLAIQFVALYQKMNA